MKNKSYQKKFYSFWKKKSKAINWFNEPKIILKKKDKNFFEWFPDGKLNAAMNCLEKKSKNKIAIYQIDKKGKVTPYSFYRLREMVFSFSYILRNLNLKKGNSRVMIHASSSIESAVSMLSCAQLGFHHCVIFEDLSIHAIQKRISIFKPDIFITRADECFFNEESNEIIKKLTKNCKLIAFKKFNMKNVLNIKIDQLLGGKKFCSYRKLKSNHKLFSLFTSGTTGEPKGITHSTGGYLVYAKFTCSKQFGMRKKSTILTASDVGWITGHTYQLYGPLLCGSTTVLTENSNILTNQELLKELLINLKINILYLPVTLIRIFKAVTNLKYIKVPSLAILGSVGEPLSPSIGTWFSKYFCLEKKSIINTYFQTETGGIISSPRYDDKKDIVTHGSVGRVTTSFIKLSLEKKNDEKIGEIFLNNLWPGCMIGLLNNKDWEKYWDRGRFKMFDIGSFDIKKQLNVHGRIDDVINIRGHRIGSEEVESEVIKIEGIKEVSATSTEDKLEGDRLIVFAVLNKNQKKNNVSKLKKDIEICIVNNFGRYASPKKIFFVNQLPKTRSGKILRRFLRDLSSKQDFDFSNIDKSIMLDRNMIQDLIKNVKK